MTGKKRVREPEPLNTARLTPRELAAVLNEARRTPAAGVVAIPAGVAPAQPNSALAVASALGSSMTVPEPDVPELTEVLLFRLGGERFAAALAAIDEAVDLPVLHSIPESPRELLGVFELRGRLIPLYSAARALRVTELVTVPACAFVLSHEGARLGIAVDALDDAITLPAAALRDAPGAETEGGDGVLLGVAHVPDGVVTVVSATALARSCLASVVHGQEQESSAASEAA